MPGADAAASFAPKPAVALRRQVSGPLHLCLRLAMIGRMGHLKPSGGADDCGRDLVALAAAIKSWGRDWDSRRSGSLTPISLAVEPRRRMARSGFRGRARLYAKARAKERGRRRLFPAPCASFPRVPQPVRRTCDSRAEARNVRPKALLRLATSSRPLVLGR